MKMSVEEVTDAYIEKFGGFPSFLLMGATDEEIVKLLTECLKTGKPLKPPVDDADY